MFADVFSPLKGVGRMISNPVETRGRASPTTTSSNVENDRLREQIAPQKGDSIAAQAALRDYQELVAQLDLPSLKDFTNVTAQVLTYSPTNVQQTVEINEGTAKGIPVGMPVVNAAGLVGKVIEVYENSSLVLLITDPSYSVTVRIVGTQPMPGTDGQRSPATRRRPTDGAGRTSPSIRHEQRPAADLRRRRRLTERRRSARKSNCDATVDGPDHGRRRRRPCAPTTTTLDFNNLPQPGARVARGGGSGQQPGHSVPEQRQRAKQIKPGDAVVTDGGRDSLAPAGLNVGCRSVVTQRAGAGGPLVEVEPAANLRRSTTCG